MKWSLTDVTWQEIGDTNPTSVLRSIVSIGHVNHSLVAVRINVSRFLNHDAQEAFDADAAYALKRIRAAQPVSPDGYFHAVRLHGYPGAYALMMVPFMGMWADNKTPTAEEAEVK